MKELLQQYAAELAALVGALIGLKFVENLTRWLALVSVASGVLLSWYATPITVYYIAPPEAIVRHVTGAVGAFYGFSGFALLAFLHLILRRSGDAAAEAIPNLIRRWLGKFGGNDDGPR